MLCCVKLLEGYNFKITYPIGNWFDIASGLSSDANTVVSKYRKEVDESRKIVDEAENDDETENDGISKALEAMHQSLSKDFEAWSDFEMAIAESLAIWCCKRSNPSSVFKTAFRHFNTFFVQLY